MVNVIVAIYDFDNNMYNVSSRIVTLQTSASLDKPCVEATIELYHNVMEDTPTNLPIYIRPRFQSRNF